MRTYTSENKIYFGQYKGDSVKKVYQGLGSLDENAVRKVIKYLSSPIPDGSLFEKAARSGELDDRKYSWPLPTEKAIFEARIKGALDEISSVHYGYELALQCSGNPKYIEWLILNVPNFCLSEGTMSELQALEVYTPVAVNLEEVDFKVSEARWTAKVELEVSKSVDFQFSQLAIETNDEKLSEIGAA